MKLDYDNRNFKISVSWPLLLSKRFGSVFLCQIYLPEGRPRVVRNIKAELGDQLSREENRSSKIKFGKRIIVINTSQDISFSEPVTKTINEPVIKAAFLGKPNDDC